MSLAIFTPAKGAKYKGLRTIIKLKLLLVTAILLKLVKLIQQ
jgi:hypothetical protein